MESDIPCFKSSMAAVLRMVSKVARIQAETPVRGHDSKTDEEYFVLSRDDIKWRWEKVVRL